MKNKILKLTESDLVRIIEKVVKEGESKESQYTIIKPGIILPPDFIIDNLYLNRYKYIIEAGHSLDGNGWFGEYQIPPTNEMVALNLLGVHTYKPVRYRLRTDEDEDFNPDNLDGRREQVFYDDEHMKRMGFTRNNPL